MRGREWMRGTDSFSLRHAVWLYPGGWHAPVRDCEPDPHPLSCQQSRGLLWGLELVGRPSKTSQVLCLGGACATCPTLWSLRARTTLVISGCSVSFWISSSHPQSIIIIRLNFPGVNLITRLNIDSQENILPLYIFFTLFFSKNQKQDRYKTSKRLIRAVKDLSA